MYPHERSLVKELAGKPFVLVGVNSDETPEALQRAIERESITWSSFFDGGGTDGPIATRWGVRGWPTIFVIDHEGVIRERDLRGAELDAAVKRLLEEIPAHLRAK